MHFISSLLLLCPCVGPDLVDAPPELSVRLEQPRDAFQLGEKMMMQATFTNTSPVPLCVGPIVMEHNGFVGIGRSSFHCGRGVCNSSIMTASTTVDVEIARNVKMAETDELEEVEEIYPDEEWPDSHDEFTLMPGESATVEFDVANTKLGSLINAAGKYSVAFAMESETTGSIDPSAARRWQGKVHSNTVRFQVVNK